MVDKVVAFTLLFSFDGEEPQLDLNLETDDGETHVYDVRDLIDITKHGERAAFVVSALHNAARAAIEMDLPDRPYQPCPVPADDER